MKVEGLLRCKCGREIIIYRDNKGEIQIKEYTPELGLNKNEGIKYEI